MKRTVVMWMFVASMVMTLASCSKNASSFDDLVAARRSVRSYDPNKKISENEVRTLIATAQEAPSWANVQATRYYAVMSEEKLQEVKAAMLNNQKTVSDVPVLIVTTYKRDQSGFFSGEAANEVGNGWGAFDTGLGNAFLVLKAKEMGFDTVIMGLRDADALRNILSIPGDEIIMSVVALGYGNQVPRRPERKAQNEILYIK
ncbi:MAG: nitroreductase family protein [Bacteroidales bacterium]|nr:nitroreductase family protein [Bacteroidales bacterium]